VERLQAYSEVEITNLSVLEAEEMEFSMVEHAKLTAQIQE
jgi:hypothetical protein